MRFLPSTVVWGSDLFPGLFKYILSKYFPAIAVTGHFIRGWFVLFCDGVADPVPCSFKCGFEVVIFILGGGEGVIPRLPATAGD